MCRQHEQRVKCVALVNLKLADYVNGTLVLESSKTEVL